MEWKYFLCVDCMCVWFFSLLCLSYYLFFSYWLALSVGGLICYRVAVLSLLAAALWDPLYCLAASNSHFWFVPLCADMCRNVWPLLPLTSGLAAVWLKCCLFFWPFCSGSLLLQFISSFIHGVGRVVLSFESLLDDLHWWGLSCSVFCGRCQISLLVPL